MPDAAITSLTADGSFKGREGTMFCWLVTFDDNFTGASISKKNPPPYKVGDRCTYDLKGQQDRDGREKIKVQISQNPHAGNAGGGQSGGGYSSEGQRIGQCLNQACEMYRSLIDRSDAINGFKPEQNPDVFQTKDAQAWIWKMASLIYNVGHAMESGHIKGLNKPQAAPPPPQQPAAPAPAQDKVPMNYPPQPQQPAQRPQPGPGGSVALDPDEDPVPF